MRFCSWVRARNWGSFSTSNAIKISNNPKKLNYNVLQFFGPLDFYDIFMSIQSPFMGY